MSLLMRVTRSDMLAIGVTRPAAYAKLAGIDDSDLEGHKYYPWDLGG